MIVVAVPNTNRNRDMTPGSGAITFQRVLAEEVIPWVERNFRASPERILVGHSLRASFVVHTFLNRPELFAAYVARRRESDPQRVGGSDFADFGERRPMIRPVEMTKSLPMELHDGAISTTTDVWNMLVASRDGDLDRVKELLNTCPALLTCQYDYTTPMHFAVREGHLDLVREQVQRGALNPTYLTHPFRDSLVTMAEDRGQVEIAEFLARSLDDATIARARGDTGRIDYGEDETQRRFQDLVDKNKHAEVEKLLKEHPELALNETAFWGEGILMMPAKDGDRQMLELLMRFGARVPDSSKWGARYYFRHYEIAAFLLENGMNPDHTNWRQFTLLHDMAFIGDLRKASLLLDHGADINAIDEDYSSSPLGYAARWGRREMVALLLERGADPNGAGAPWARPLAWARKKGYTDIEADLRRAGGIADA